MASHPSLTCPQAGFCLSMACKANYPTGPQRSYSAPQPSTPVTLVRSPPVQFGIEISDLFQSLQAFTRLMVPRCSRY